MAFETNSTKPIVYCVILSGAAVSSAVEESTAYHPFDTNKILRRASLAQDDTCGVKY